MTIFDEGEAKIWGLGVTSTNEGIVEVIRFLTIGEHYQNEHDARSSQV